MSEIVFSPLSSILKEGGDSDENTYLSATKEAFNNFECKKHGSYSEEHLAKYIKEGAIDKEKAHESRTYLYLKANDASGLDLVGFFALSLTCVCFDELSASAKKKIRSHLRSRRNGWIGAYCIAELARSDKFKDDLPGYKILQDAMKIIRDSAEAIGCSLVILDAEPDVFEKFYKRNQFKKIVNETVQGHPVVVAATNIANFNGALEPDIEIV